MIQFIYGLGGAHQPVLAAHCWVHQVQSLPAVKPTVTRSAWLCTVASRLTPPSRWVLALLQWPILGSKLTFSTNISTIFC